MPDAALRVTLSLENDNHKSVHSPGSKSAVDRGMVASRRRPGLPRLPQAVGFESFSRGRLANQCHKCKIGALKSGSCESFLEALSAMQRDFG